MIGHAILESLRSVDLVTRRGRVHKILPTHVEADGPDAPLGSLCALQTREGPGQTGSRLAEVIRIDRDHVTLAPLEEGGETIPGAEVVLSSTANLLPVGDSFAGRAIDALGRPIDGRAPVRATTHAVLTPQSLSPLTRASPRRVVETGIRAIDALLTLGHGQRVGVFAASGVGKSSLVGQLLRQVEADRCVVCLVGERGREVEALWSRGLTDEARARTTLVAATSDQPAAMRVRACHYALALADHWRAQGLHVLLVLDSVTRLAMAMREVGLAAGEPPTVRAFTPSVFAGVPRIVERCGALRSGGAITAVFTVLAETDELDDPISEMLRSILDGHIVLSRRLAEQGHFPAIDIPRSLSRLAAELVDDGRRAAAQRAVELLSAYERSRTMIEAGVYVGGADATIDEAIRRRPALLAFLRQSQFEGTAFGHSAEALADAVGLAA